MHRLMLASLSALALIAVPAQAQPGEPGKPVTDREPDAVDVATTPMNDLNIRKDEIPQLLIAAQTSPYSLTGLSRCSQLAAQIGELDALLGDDLDLPQTPGQRLSPGRIGEYVVGSFIPFRGLIREVSGAADQRRRMEQAITAGMARRAFLKGVGQERGCRYPARSATRDIWDQQLAALRAAKEHQAKQPDPGRDDAAAGKAVADSRGHPRP